MYHNVYYARVYSIASITKHRHGKNNMHPCFHIRMAMGRVSTRPAQTRPAPFRDPPQKTRLLPRPVCFNGYPFNPTCWIPDGYPTRFFFFIKFYAMG